MKIINEENFSVVLFCYDILPNKIWDFCLAVLNDRDKVKVKRESKETAIVRENIPAS